MRVWLYSKIRIVRNILMWIKEIALMSVLDNFYSHTPRKSDSTIAINTFSTFVKGIVAGILRPEFISSIITTTITSFVSMIFFVNMMISNR